MGIRELCPESEPLSVQTFDPGQERSRLSNQDDLLQILRVSEHLGQERLGSACRWLPSPNEDSQESKSKGERLVSTQLDHPTPT